MPKTLWQTCLTCGKQFRGRYMAMDCATCKRKSTPRGNANYCGPLTGKDDEWVERHEVASSDLERMYTVSRHRDGHWGCSCPVWKFKRQECKHIDEVRRRIHELA